VQELTGITPERLRGAPAFPRPEGSTSRPPRRGLLARQSVFEFDVPLLRPSAHAPPHARRAAGDPRLGRGRDAPAGPPEERWSTSRLLARFAVDTVGLRRHDALDDVKILGRLLAPLLRLALESRGDRLEIPAATPLFIKRHPPVRAEPA
jgi:hypothetical protein